MWNPSKDRAARRARAAPTAADLLREAEARQRQAALDSELARIDRDMDAVGFDAEEMWGAKACARCEEPFKATDEVGEFYDPQSALTEPMDDGNGGTYYVHEHYIAHAQCGLDAEWELA